MVLQSPEGASEANIKGLNSGTPVYAAKGGGLGGLVNQGYKAWTHTLTHTNEKPLPACTQICMNKHDSAVTLTHPARCLTHKTAHTHIFTEWIKAIELGLEALRSGPGELCLQAHSIMTISTQTTRLKLINGLLLCRYMRGQEQSTGNKWAWWTRERQDKGGWGWGKGEGWERRK